MQNHTEAIKLLQDWSKWLVGLNSAAITALGVLTTRPGYGLEAMPLATATSGACALVFLLTSLLLANWLLLAMPGVIQRATAESKDDIFSEGTYAGVGLCVVFFARGQHIFFIAGVFATVAFVLAPYHPAWSWCSLAISALGAGHFVSELARWPTRFRKQ